MTKCVIGIDAECDEDCRRLQITFGDVDVPVFICGYDPKEIYYFTLAMAEPLTEDSDADTLDSGELTSTEEGLIIYE